MDQLQSRIPSLDALDPTQLTHQTSLPKAGKEFAFRVQLGYACFLLGEAKQPPSINFKDLKIPPFIQQLHTCAAEFLSGVPAFSLLNHHFSLSGLNR
jgi:hypothetical protein